jgi:hypothetical protein
MPHLMQTSLHARRKIKVSFERLNLLVTNCMFENSGKKCADLDPVKDDGFLADINIASLSNDEIKPKHDRKGQDVDRFFGAKYSEPGVDGKLRTYRDCTLCSKKGPCKRFVKDLSTCRRHLEKNHEVSVDICDYCNAN